MLIYLAFSALSVFVFACVLLISGESSFLAVTHLVLALGIAPLIFGAITHFVPVLTRSREPQRAIFLAPVLLQLTGILVFLYFYTFSISIGVLHAVAGISFLTAVGFSGWMIFRARHTLGKPHPGWRWYLAAILFLVVGLALVPAMDFWPELRQEFRLLHLHLNTLGFIGLAAVGTLQVLLPTVLSGPDTEAAARLRQDLPGAVAGVLCIGLGAAFWWPLSLLGAGLLSLAALRLGLSWLRRYGWRPLIRDGAAAALVAALLGFLLMLAFGVAHAFGQTVARYAVPAFVVGFLLPLVSGALSQLLPIWRFPGRRTAVRDRMRTVLVSGGSVRAALFVTGGVLLALGYGVGVGFAAGGLALFLYALLRAYLPHDKK